MVFYQNTDMPLKWLSPPKETKWEGDSVLQFKFVKHLDFFATKSDNIIIGAKKLHVNTPRFVRVEVGPKTKEKAMILREVENIKGKSVQPVNTTDAIDVEDIKSKSSQTEKAAREEDNNKIKTQWREPRPHEVNFQDKVIQGRDRCSINASRDRRRKRRAWRRKKHTGNHRGFWFEISEEDIERFIKMFVGYVKQPGMTQTSSLV